MHYARQDCIPIWCVLGLHFLCQFLRHISAQYHKESIHQNKENAVKLVRLHSGTLPLVCNICSASSEFKSVHDNWAWWSRDMQAWWNEPSWVLISYCASPFIVTLLWDVTNLIMLFKRVPALPKKHTGKTIRVFVLYFTMFSLFNSLNPPINLIVKIVCQNKEISCLSQRA